MLNKIWFWLLCIGIVYGLCKASYQTKFPPPAPVAAPGPSDVNKTDAPNNDSALTAMGKRLNGAVLEATKSSIDICIPLIGIMALWLGLLNVAKDAGLIDVFARL